MYADDSALGYADCPFKCIKAALERDLASICNYFEYWHLKLGLKKAVCSIFHLANCVAHRRLNINLNGNLKLE